MRAAKKDTSYRQLTTSKPVATPGIPEPWYNHLNETGPRAGFVPLIDDDPPFYLRESPLVSGSPNALETEPTSSRPGQSSQIPPLSHSLLSRLELNENDLDTFREVIDDLTVQNKTLKRRLKKFEKIRSKGLRHDGLFELRIHNLSLEKKQELEMVLQRFASTVGPSQARSISNQIGSEKSRRTHLPAVRSRPTPSSSRYTKGLDPAYASVSATGATSRPKLDQSRVPKSQSHNDLRAPAGHAPSNATNSGFPDTDSRGPSIVSDRTKQKLVVKRLEELFLTHNDDRRAPKGGDVHLYSANLGSSCDDMTQGRFQKDRSNDTATNILLDNSRNAHELLQKDNLQHSGTMNLPQLPKLPRIQSFQADRSHPDTLRYLRDLGLASPVAGSELVADDEWVYLNLLINLAQLHTLSVTLESVRQAIQNTSTRLALSEDGRKVRWQGDLQPSAVSPEYVHNIALTNQKSVLASFECPSSPMPPEQTSWNTLTIQEQNSSRLLKDPQASGGQSPERADRLQALPTRQTPATRLAYKPMFSHKHRRLRKSDQASSSSSNGSRSCSSKHGKAATSSDVLQETTYPSSGPLVFFDRDPFFLDLSTDDPNRNRIDHSSYPNVDSEPLGQGRRSFKPPHVIERRQTLSSFSKLDNSGSRQKIESAWQQHPLLRDYGANPTPTPTNSNPNEANRIPFEASGIGGIQLDDNFAIDVTTSQQPVPHPPPPSNHRLHNLNPSAATPTKQPTHQRFFQHQPISTDTTFLPPSPLPPPSYVYPALSSSSEESDDEYISSDDLGSESDYELRKVSLSPQVRTWVEEQSMSPGARLGGGEEEGLSQGGGSSRDGGSGMEDDDEVDD
ncbi:MAG: hypothetical protein Q9170_004613 [Blastenia crenularia]